jgi:2-dehydro-3-deoxygalactonokinase
LLADDGSVLAEHAAPRGLLSVPTGGWAAAFEAEFGAWLAVHPGLPCLMAGMVGSRQGWVEAPYCACPANLADLAARLCWVQPGRVAIVPGLSVEVDGLPDVMRGEETQVFGALALLGLSQATLVLPGTHSKWVTVRDARITGLRTYLTGETFAVLSAHSILGRLFDTSADPGARALDTPAADAAFAAGVRQGHAQPAALLHLVFRVRTEGLFGRLSPSAAPAYLSGLLTGAEIADAHAWQGSAATPILIGAAEQTQRYARALHCLHRTARIAPAHCTAAGLYAIARAGGLLANPAL